MQPAISDPGFEIRGDGGGGGVQEHRMKTIFPTSEQYNVVLLRVPT